MEKNEKGGNSESATSIEDDSGNSVLEKMRCEDNYRNEHNHPGNQRLHSATLSHSGIMRQKVAHKKRHSVRNQDDKELKKSYSYNKELLKKNNILLNELIKVKSQLKMLEKENDELRNNAIKKLKQEKYQVNKIAEEQHRSLQITKKQLEEASKEIQVLELELSIAKQAYESQAKVLDALKEDENIMQEDGILSYQKEKNSQKLLVNILNDKIEVLSKKLNKKKENCKKYKTKTKELKKECNLLKTEMIKLKQAYNDTISKGTLKRSKNYSINTKPDNNIKDIMIAELNDKNHIEKSINNFMRKNSYNEIVKTRPYSSHNGVYPKVDTYKPRYVSQAVVDEMFPFSTKQYSKAPTEILTPKELHREERNRMDWNMLKQGNLDTKTRSRGNCIPLETGTIPYQRQTESIIYPKNTYY